MPSGVILSGWVDTTPRPVAQKPSHRQPGIFFSVWMAPDGDRSAPGLTRVPCKGWGANFIATVNALHLERNDYIEVQGELGWSSDYRSGPCPHCHKDIAEGVQNPNQQLVVKARRVGVVRRNDGGREAWQERTKIMAAVVAESEDLVPEPPADNVAGLKKALDWG